MTIQQTCVKATFVSWLSLRYFAGRFSRSFTHSGSGNPAISPPEEHLISESQASLEFQTGKEISSIATNSGPSLLFTSLRKLQWKIRWWEPKQTNFRIFQKKKNYLVSEVIILGRLNEKWRDGFILTGKTPPHQSGKLGIRFPGTSSTCFQMLGV
jgi:hypothetical protein